MVETLPLIKLITTASIKTVENRILEAQFGNGYRQVTSDGLNSNIDKWKIQYAPITGVNLATLDTFLNTVGVIDWFTWIPLGETTSKKWRIDKNSLTRTMLDTSRYAIKFTITQSFDLG